MKAENKALMSTDLLPLEDVLVEVLLQLLVGEVDAELLEVVERKALEAVDVKQTDTALAGRQGR